MHRFVATALAFCACVSGSLSAQQRYPAPADIQMLHIALLFAGPNSGTGTKEDQDAVQAAHIAHLTKLGRDGNAIIAGPIGEGKGLQGIVILRGASTEAAQALEAADPAVKSGRLRIEMVSFIAPGNWFSVAPIPTDIKMRNYVFGFLNVGPNRAGSDADAKKMQDDHLANMWALRQSGDLVLGGSATNSPTRAGVVIMTADTVAKATAILSQDPTVKAGRTTIELYRWFAADGILKGK